MLAVIASLIISQAPSIGPVIPAGASAEFQAVCIAIEDKLSKGDFVGAQKDLRLLPKRKFVVGWDASKLSASDKLYFAEARDKAIETWKSGLEIDITVGPNPDILLSFVDVLPKVEGDPYPPGAVHFFNDEASKARMEVVIGLRRAPNLHIPGTKPKNPTSLDFTVADDVHNEVGYAISAYLGLAEAKLSGSFTSRSDQSAQVMTRLAPAEVRLANQLFEVSKVLRDAVVKKKRLVAARPKISLQPTTLELPTAKQGDTVRFSIQVNNLGNAKLNYRVQPDCGCLAASFDPEVMPGKSTLIQATVNTVDFVGNLRKRFFIYSNDPEVPSQDVVVTIKVVPLYRFLMPDGGTVLLDEGPKVVYAYLVLADGVEMDPAEVRMDGGLRATVTHERWTGSLADLEMGEGELPRRGYRFAINIDENQPVGRSAGTLVIATGNNAFPSVRRTLYAQKGIVALPDMVYFGQVPKAQRKAAFLLSRPEHDFNILKIECDSPFFKAIAVPTRGKWEYRITVEFDGKADFGVLDTVLKVATDDPKQPQILIPVRAIVK